MRSSRRRSQGGQLVIGVLLVLILMATLVPLMVMFTKKESEWAAKQSQSTTAFHLAEAGVEKAYRALSLSTVTWFSLVDDGTAIDNFNFDLEFNDLDYGTYTVGISSGPDSRQATVISIGKDKRRNEIRALKVVYGQNILGDIAIQSLDGVHVTGSNVEVEWGAIVSPEPIDAGGRDHPQFWSASSIIGYDIDPAPENCDQPNCWQWFSFNSEVPPDPGININFYRSSASLTSAGCPSGGDGGTCYFGGDTAWSSNVDYSGGSTVFIEGNLDVSAHITIKGNLVVTGNLTLPNGRWGLNDCTMIMPQTAWKQYGNDWANYNFGDGTKPAEFPGLDSDYLSPLGHTYNETKCAVIGFLYVGGNFAETGGGGNTTIYGSMFVVGSVTLDMSSQFRVYYNKEAAENVHTTRLVLNRRSWEAALRPWPAGL